MARRRSRSSVRGMMETLETRQLLTATVTEVTDESVEVGAASGLENIAESDDLYQVLAESSAEATLDHQWRFDLPEYESAVVSIEAHTDGDEHFWLSYSVDGGYQFETFHTITDSADSEFRFTLPTDSAEQLIVKVRDAGRADLASSVFVDQLVVETTLAPVASSAQQTELEAAIIAASQSANTQLVLSAIPNLNREVRVTIIGDSISSGISSRDAQIRGYSSRKSYRPVLWDRIQSAGNSVADVRFVGAWNYNSDGLPSQASAHSTYRGFATYSFFPFPNHPRIGSNPNGAVNNYAHNADGWATVNPDVAIINVGANDVLEGRSITRSRNDIRDMIGELRADNPNIVILLSTIVPFSSSRARSSRVPVFNEMLTGLVRADGSWRGSTSKSPIHIVDHYGGMPGLPKYKVGSHTADGVHPNAAGDRVLADNIWSVLRPLLTVSGKVPSNPTPSPAAPANPAPAPTPKPTLPQELPNRKAPVTHNVLLDVENPGTVNESDGFVDVMVRVRGNSVYDHPINIYYSTVNGSAKAGSDFTGAKEKKLVLPAYTNRVRVRIPIVSDSNRESNETFRFALVAAAPQNGVGPNDVRFGNPQATITIRDSGNTAAPTPKPTPTPTPAPTPKPPSTTPPSSTPGKVTRDPIFLDLQNATVTEGSNGQRRTANFDLVIRDNKAFFHPIYAYVSTVSGSADPGRDYVHLKEKRILIPAGANRVSISVEIIADERREGTETFQLKLLAAAPANGVAPGSARVGRGTAIGTIRDND